MAELSRKTTSAEYQQYRLTGLLPGEPPAQPEAQFQANVCAYAKDHGWLAYHTHDARRSEAGYPDLTLVRPRRLVFAELKTGSRKLTSEQYTWMDLLSRSVEGVETYCWTPKDWPTILEVLR